MDTTGVAKVDVVGTRLLPIICPPEAFSTWQKLIADGWRIFAVIAVRGRCRWSSKTLTIPSWALRKGKLYAQWYIAHELSHAVAGFKAGHGPEFMAVLKTLCCPEAAAFELTYKPREAFKAGILDTNF